MKEIWILFCTFVKISISTFGGGYAMMPALKRELIEKRNYISEGELLDYYAIGQCTPGLFGTNVATFVGYKIGKTPGALVATAGIIFPSAVIIILIASLLQNFANLPAVVHAFRGIRVVVIVLILNTAVGMWKKSVKGAMGFILFAATIAASFIPFVSPAVAIIACGVIGIIVYYFSPGGGDEEP